MNNITCGAMFLNCERLLRNNRNISAFGDVFFKEAPGYEKVGTMFDTWVVGFIRI